MLVVVNMFSDSIWKKQNAVTLSDWLEAES